MLNNIYSALSGALAQEKVLDIIANNLANVNTNGFKEESVSFTLLESEPWESYSEPLPPANYKEDLSDVMPLKGNDINYVGISGVVTNFTQGSASQTKNPLDIMIEGEGFLSINTKEGVRYSRDGALTLNPSGALVDKQGNPVLGEKGNIFLSNHKVQINSLGEVYQNNEYVDRILVNKFEDTNLLEKVGNNYFFHTGKEENVTMNPTPAIKQGYLEASNVNAIKNLTNMILAHRCYEAYNKAIKNFDTIMDKTSNSIGQANG